MKLVPSSVTKTAIWFPFWLLPNTVREIREKLFPRVKSENPNSRFFPAKPEKCKIREIKLPRNISLHMVNCERVCFSCNLSASVPRFQQLQLRIRELRKFFGQENHRPPKTESARTPMALDA